MINGNYGFRLPSVRFRPGPKPRRRISRPCYDKFHRCPGWAGGGIRFAEVDRCNGGRIEVDYDAALWKWRMWPCDVCNVVALPYMIRYVDPVNLWYTARRKLLRLMRLGGPVSVALGTRPDPRHRPSGGSR